MKKCFIHCLIFIGLCYAIPANALCTSPTSGLPLTGGTPDTALAAVTEKEVPQQVAVQAPATTVGLRVGVNLSVADFNKGYPKPQEPIETYWKRGYLAGLFIEMPLLQRLYLQQEYLYSQMGGNVPSLGTVYKLSYVALPVLLKYKPNKGIAVVAGPELGLLVQANAKVNGRSYTITHDVEQRSIGVIAGVELMLVENVYIDARYMHGLNHIGIASLTGSTEFKYKSVQLTLKINLATPFSPKKIPSV